MGKPTVMTGWWLLLLEQKAGGRIDLLARLCGVSTRTIHRWQAEKMKPDFEKRKMLRKLAGQTLMSNPLLPIYLRVKKANA